MRLSHKFLKAAFLFSIILFSCSQSFSQYNNSTQQSQSGQSNVTYDSQGRPIKKTSGKDSLQKRDRYADSITIFYRYYDSTRTRTLDTSINDFNTRFVLPYTYEDLGNMGTAARPLLFNPILKAGWDAGFHQYDIYKFTVENTRFFQTTRPYTELGYLLGSKNEQLVNFVHTQNKKNNFNFSIEYRFLNSPGIYRTQNASHNNFRFTTHYQTPNKRYESFFIFLSNKHASSENGGLVDKSKLDSLALGDPFELPTRLGSPADLTSNPFNTTVNTGNVYKESNFLYRHQYDLGTKDSLVTDSVTYHLFHPRLRLQHTIQFATNEYLFRDLGPSDSMDAATDSIYYAKYFNYKLPTAAQDTISFKDRWTRTSNELSIISFPDKDNQSQFAKVGAIFQTMRLTAASTVTDTVTHNFYNISAIGEYRNRTRNNIWDIIANGQLYLNGFNAGDYQAFISLKRQLSKRIGSLQIGFQNVDRTPSFIYNSETAFPIEHHVILKKENTTHLFAFYDNPKSGLRLSGDYYLLNNYAYSDSFFSVKQFASLFNVLHVYGEKKFKLARYVNYYLELHLQQTTGAAPVNIPQLLTRQRIAFEGNFYTNLFLATGLEARYSSDYKSPNYSPFTGQFFYQDNTTLSNRPDVDLFFNVRIKSFKAYFRAENLNTVNPSQGYAFNHYNFKLPDYPNVGFHIRLGIWWNFVN